jgi:hypothetical protein
MFQASRFGGAAVVLRPAGGGVGLGGSEDQNGANASAGQTGQGP